MGIAWGTLTFVVALLFCGGWLVFAYGIAAEGLSRKKRICLVITATATVVMGLMVQNAKECFDERITTLELKVWLHEQGTAKKVIDALK